MAVHEIPGLPPHPVAVSNGQRTVTFDTPSDFADWIDRIGGVCNLSAWHWVGPVISAN